MRLLHYIYHSLRILHVMSVQLDTLNASVADLSAKVDILIAKPPVSEDLSATQSAVEAIAAKVVAAS